MAIGAKALGGAVLGGVAIPLGAIVGVGSAVYLASMAIYWNSNENTVRTINDYVD